MMVVNITERLSRPHWPKYGLHAHMGSIFWFDWYDKKLEAKYGKRLEWDGRWSKRGASSYLNYLKETGKGLGSIKLHTFNNTCEINCSHRGVCIDCRFAPHRAHSYFLGIPIMMFVGIALPGQGNHDKICAFTIEFDAFQARLGPFWGQCTPSAVR